MTSLLSSTHLTTSTPPLHLAFGQQAHHYEQHSDIQREAAHLCYEWVEEDCQGLTALELGAGTGLFTRLLEQSHFSWLLATDLSQEMIEQGKARSQRAQWCAVDAWTPPPGLFVHRLYSTSLLQWALEPSQVVTRWRRLLYPGGRALLSLFTRGSLRELEALAPHLSPCRWLSCQEWQDIFVASGFEILRSEPIQRVYSYPSACEALRTLHRTGAVTPHRLGPAALRKIMRAYDRQASRTAGVEMTWCALRIELRRPESERRRIA